MTSPNAPAPRVSCENFGTPLWLGAFATFLIYGFSEEQALEMAAAGLTVVGLAEVIG